MWVAKTRRRHLLRDWDKPRTIWTPVCWEGGDE